MANSLVELYHDVDVDEEDDDDFDLLSSPVIELDHKVEEVRFAEIGRRLLRELCASYPTPGL